MNERGTYGNKSCSRHGRTTIGEAAFQGIEAKDYDSLFRDLKKSFAEKRGSDKLMPPAGEGGIQIPFVIPRTTNRDVIQLATYWTDETKKIDPRLSGHGVTERSKASQDLLYKAGQVWGRAIANVELLAKSGKPDDVYPNNNQFWRAIGDVSIALAAIGETPSRWSLMAESLEYGVKRLPTTLYEAGAKAVDVAGGSLKTALYVGLGILGIVGVVAVSSAIKKGS